MNNTKKKEINMNNTKKIEHMSENEIEQLALENRGMVFQMLQTFFASGKEVTRGIVAAMVIIRCTDFGCIELKKLDLSNLNLKGCNFEGAQIRRCDFSGSDLSGATFEYAKVDDCDFSNALLIGAFMYSGKFNECTFQNTDLLYAGALPEYFDQNNYHVNNAFPTMSVFLDCNDEENFGIAKLYLTTLLDYIVDQGVDRNDHVSLAVKAYPYFKVELDGLDMNDSYFKYFSQIYPEWLISRDKNVTEQSISLIMPLFDGKVERYIKSIF